MESRNKLMIKSRKAIEHLRFDLTNCRKAFDEKSNVSETVGGQVKELKEEVIWDRGLRRGRGSDCLLIRGQTPNTKHLTRHLFAFPISPNPPVPPEKLSTRVSEYTTLLDAFKLLESNQVRLQSDNSALKSEADRNKTLRMELSKITEEVRE